MVCMYAYPFGVRQMKVGGREYLHKEIVSQRSGADGCHVQCTSVCLGFPDWYVPTTTGPTSASTSVSPCTIHWTCRAQLQLWMERSPYMLQKIQPDSPLCFISSSTLRRGVLTQYQ
jgi:hypothetical protein